MTYRHLFFYLLAVSTLISAVVWWRTLVSENHLAIDTPAFGLKCSFHYGTVGLHGGSHEHSAIGYGVNFYQEPPFFTEWKIGEVLGVFHIGRSDRYGDSTPSFSIKVPIWFFFLAFNACAWGFCRVMEKRTLKA